ncbi:hypothetical protein HPB47_025791 [Ixodes persulcatus]|uniref:Uncharacterized protein n=1 Tax=Ixodes persulcatus TaxID=34615 RepID=A0AC60Q0H3_IXOPE|nr:hypothetical protein HPB47_025791 [Ixodes persulcatus]
MSQNVRIIRATTRNGVLLYTVGAGQAGPRGRHGRRLHRRGRLARGGGGAPVAPGSGLQKLPERRRLNSPSLVRLTGPGPGGRPGAGSETEDLRPIREFKMDGCVNVGARWKKGEVSERCRLTTEQACQRFTPISDKRRVMAQHSRSSKNRPYLRTRAGDGAQASRPQPGSASPGDARSPTGISTPLLALFRPKSLNAFVYKYRQLNE